MAIEYLMIANWQTSPEEIEKCLLSDGKFFANGSTTERQFIFSTAVNASISSGKGGQIFEIDDKKHDISIRIRILFTLAKDAIAEGKKAMVVACAKLLASYSGTATLANLEQIDAPVLAFEGGKFWIDAPQQSDFWDSGDANGNFELLGAPVQRARINMLYE